MKFSQIKAIRAFTLSLVSEPCFREVVEQASINTNDFEVNNVRFIAAHAIDEIQAEELTNDLYCLGCFNASFIAPMLNLDQEWIELIQEAEGFEKLGKYIQNNCDMVEFAMEYSSADGYGHHFNRYDHSQEEITIDGVDYLVFDNQ